jgi:hypothetical protein
MPARSGEAPERIHSPLHSSVLASIRSPSPPSAPRPSAMDRERRSMTGHHQAAYPPIDRPSSLPTSASFLSLPLACLPEFEPTGTTGPAPPHGHGRRTAASTRRQAASSHLQLSQVVQLVRLVLGMAQRHILPPEAPATMVAVGTAIVGPPTHVAEPLPTASHRSSATHGCRMARRCSRRPSAPLLRHRRAAGRPSPSPVLAPLLCHPEMETSRPVLPPSLSVYMTGGSNRAAGPTCQFL